MDNVAAFQSTYSAELVKQCNLTQDECEILLTVYRTAIECKKPRTQRHSFSSTSSSTSGSRMRTLSLGPTQQIRLVSDMLTSELRQRLPSFITDILAKTPKDLSARWKCYPDEKLKRIMRATELGAEQYVLQNALELKKTPKGYYESLLLRAARCNRVLVGFAAKRGNINCRATDNDRGFKAGHTPLYVAVKYGQPKIVAILVLMGANVELGSENRNPLHKSAILGNLETIKHLVDGGASIHAQDHYKKTPMHYASEKGHTHLVEYLYNDLEDIEGNTPLHVAALFNKAEIIECLLQKGSAINATNNRKKTALELAQEENAQAAISVLCSHSGSSTGE